MRTETQKGLIKAVLAGGCAMAALMVPAAAFAAPAPAGASENTGIEEIVVTAQRRTERLENVPMAVTALTAGALERAQVVNIHEISRITPGVQIGFAGVSTQPAIRGITSLTNGSGNENNVAIYVDGFYISDNITINQDLANLQGIEVLKGPQGTLYGRNATGGAILIKTLDPSEELTGKFEGSYGKFAEKRMSGYISGPLSDKVGFMVAGAYRDSNGWMGKTDPTNNTKSIGHANPQKQRSFRAKLKAELSDTLTATAAYNYGFTSDSTGNLFTTYDHLGGGIPTNNLHACCFGLQSGNGKNIAAGKTNQATLTVEWDTPLGKLTSRSGYDRRKIRNDFDFDGTYADITFSEGFPRFKAFQQSIDYNITAIDHLDLLVGANYFNEKTFLVNKSISYPGGVRTFASETDRGLKTQAYAIYADATYHITDKLSIGAGGRYSSDKKTQSLVIYTGAGVVSGSGALLLGANGVPTAAFQQSNKTFHKFTPRATIRYEIADRTNVYATFSKGFRAGSFNSAASTTAAAILPIKPENITAYEIGFKTAHRMFRAEIAGFYYDYKNLNVSLTVPRCPACVPPDLSPTLQVGNAPKATIKGVDGQIVATPIEKLNLTLGAAYVHARYGSFPNAVGQGTNATNTLNAGFSGQTQDWTGQQMARAPDFTANFSADYSVPVATGELRLSGNVRYTTSYVVNNPSLYGPAAPAALQNKQRYRQPSFTLVDGEITWYSDGERYWIGVYGKNLTNKSYRLTYNGGAFGDYSAKAPPISYGVKVGYKF